MIPACRICMNKSGNRVHRAREMMFGFGDEFEYLECGSCGTVQLLQIPDLSRYYPEKYYSFESADNIKERIARGLAHFYHSLRSRFGTARAFSFLRSLLALVDFEGRVIDRGLGLTSVLRLDPPRDARILDVGCGDGKLLSVLAHLGFTSLTGLDRFVAVSDRSSSNVHLIQGDLFDLQGEFDVVMFHHSFEHLTDPKAALTYARNLMGAGGVCLIRLPLINFAWERYGVNWVGLDAPRHIFLFTEIGFRSLAKECGFAVEEVIYDSTSFQFSASERYIKGIPLVDSKPESSFSKRQIAKWSAEAKRLNEAGRGDQATFYLRSA